MFSPNPVAFEVYREKFAVVREGLARGDSFLLNLTVATGLETDWTLEEIFHRAWSPYRLLVPGRFVCFSPEIFVRVDEGVISSYPMKGTIDASVPDAGRVILEDYKERSEHNTIVDLIRNDLNRVAERVDVRRFRYIDRLRVSRGEILQVSSEVTGRLTGDYYSRLGEVVFGMLPAGSISGAPKPSTLRIIARAEGERRGFYTGVFGYFDGKRLDSAVMIRYIEVRDLGGIISVVAGESRLTVSAGRSTRRCWQRCIFRLISDLNNLLWSVLSRRSRCWTGSFIIWKPTSEGLG